MSTSKKLTTAQVKREEEITKKKTIAI